MKKTFIILGIFLIAIITGSKVFALTEYWYWEAKANHYYNYYYDVQTGFDGKVETTTYVFSADETVISGEAYSKVYCYGVPFVADSMTHVETISLSGLGSFSFGVPSGVTVTSGNKTVNYEYEAQNTSSITLNYTYLLYLGVVTHVYQNAQATYVIGSAIYDTSTATDAYYEYNSSHYFK